jgi:hypothetical protein
MSKANPADLPGSMAILGLLHETPDLTVGEVADGLRTRFASCRFDAGTARQTLRQMERPGRDRPPRVWCSYRAPGRSRMQDRYRLTGVGSEEFDGWMYRKPIGTPALREALYGRIELCPRLEDLPELIRIAREERDIADSLYSKAKDDLKLHLERSRRRRRRGPPTREDFLREVRSVLKHHTPEYWSARSMHYHEVAHDLEDIAKRAGIDFPPDPKP